MVIYVGLASRAEVNPESPRSQPQYRQGPAPIKKPCPNRTKNSFTRTGRNSSQTANSIADGPPPSTPTTHTSTHRHTYSHNTHTHLHPHSPRSTSAAPRANSPLAKSLTPLPRNNYDRYSYPTHRTSSQPPSTQEQAPTSGKKTSL